MTRILFNGNLLTSRDANNVVITNTDRIGVIYEVTP
jgi:hypothetical protein